MTTYYSVEIGFFAFQQLFMSANNYSTPTSSSSSEEISTEQNLLERAGLSESEEETPEGNSKDCVVCQNGPVNWVLLPCRHTCLCDSCVKYFRQCPMCRQFVQESFALCNQKEQARNKPNALWGYYNWKEHFSWGCRNVCSWTWSWHGIYHIDCQRKIYFSFMFVWYMGDEN